MKEHEYLYTVRVVETGEVKKVVAREMNGVAIMLQLELDDIVYVTKETIPLNI